MQVLFGNGWRISHVQNILSLKIKKQLMADLTGNGEFSFPSTLNVPRGEMACFGETKLMESY